MNKFKKPIFAAVFFFIAAILLFSKTNAQQHKFVESIPPQPFEHYPRLTGNVQHNGVHAPYRTFDGTNNNIVTNQKAEWGATDMPLFREIPAEYGATNPNGAMNGAGRPSPREISNVLCDEPVTQFNSRNVSAFFYVWGQFLDHDITLTPQDTIEYDPVLLPANEPLFLAPIPFFRSTVHPGTGITSSREQTNIATAYIDGSQVYGSDATTAAWMRSFQNGKMKTSAGNYLPWNTVTGEKADAIDPNAPSMGNDNGHTVKTFVAGDVRASEHPGLLALHTVFLREHNRICDRLITQGYTNDEEMYQKARKEVGALIQAITYQEFLPAIGVKLKPYTGYNSGVRADIANLFATAGYRLGHTMVADEVALRDDDCEELDPEGLDLVDIFFTPGLVVDYGLEPFLKGFSTHKQYETDNKINSVLRNFLFGPGFGIDLASLNIQRGRDHGLPNYNAVRQYYTGSAVTSFSQITSDPVKAAALQSLYGNVNNIDVWVGILAENRLSGKSVGKTVHAMLKSQFEKLRDGDYYFYKNDPYLSNSIRNTVKNTTLRDVIQRNTTLTSLQSNVFFINPCPGEDGEDRIASDYYSEESTAGFKVYPNPVNNLVNIEITEVNEPCIIKLYSSNGTLVKHLGTVAGQQTVQVNTSNFPGGVYFINIFTNKEVKSFKFVKMVN